MEIERLSERDILLTFNEAAELLRVSRATMYRLLGSGKLVGHKVGRGWRFYKSDLHGFVSSQQSTSAQFVTTPTTPDADGTLPRA
jgi:excisionase family DNA binding protein